MKKLIDYLIEGNFYKKKSLPYRLLGYDLIIDTLIPLSDVEVSVPGGQVVVKTDISGIAVVSAGLVLGENTIKWRVAGESNWNWVTVDVSNLAVLLTSVEEVLKDLEDSVELLVSEVVLKETSRADIFKYLFWDESRYRLEELMTAGLVRAGREDELGYVMNELSAVDVLDYCVFRSNYLKGDWYFDGVSGIVEYDDILKTDTLRLGTSDQGWCYDSVFIEEEGNWILSVWCRSIFGSGYIRLSYMIDGNWIDGNNTPVSTDFQKLEVRIDGKVKAVRIGLSGNVVVRLYNWKLAKEEKVLPVVLGGYRGNEVVIVRTSEVLNRFKYVYDEIDFVDYSKLSFSFVGHDSFELLKCREYRDLMMLLQNNVMEVSSVSEGFWVYWSLVSFVVVSALVIYEWMTLGVKASRGYAMGGAKPTYYLSEIDGIQFSDESAINPSATLAVARHSLAGVNSSSRGYAMGGWAGSISSEIDGIQFSDETAIDPSATLAVARGHLAGTNSLSRGYAMGGENSGDYSNEIDGIQFSNESAINPSATLTVARQSLAGVNSSSRGYAMGGSTINYSNEIDGIQFSDETAINPSATLSVARHSLAGVNSSSRGYAMGGYAGGLTGEIDGIQFSDETAINPSATLSLSRMDLAGVNSSSRGYAMGGMDTSEIDGIQFSDETAINPSATLSVARNDLAGCQSGGIL